MADQKWAVGTQGRFWMYVRSSFWKRPTGTYSILFWNDLAQLNGKKNASGVVHLPIQRVLHVGHLNSFLELGDGNLTAKTQKNQMSEGLPGVGGEGVLRFIQIDRCIRSCSHTMRVPSSKHTVTTPWARLDGLNFVSMHRILERLA